MTKKDYIALARAISTLPDATRAQACATVGMVLRVDNPAFDMEKFVKACGCDPQTPHKHREWLVLRDTRYWSNATGWTTRENATVFSDHERQCITRIGHMPSDGSQWEPVS
jgi:hypothetical protein